MLRKIRGGLRKKIYCSVLGCIIGPYILIVSLANHYFNHKTSTLIDNFYYDQPFSILESEKEILDVLKQSLSQTLLSDLTDCKNSKICKEVLKRHILNNDKNHQLSDVILSSNHLFLEAIKGEKNPKWLVNGAKHNPEFFADLALSIWRSENYSEPKLIHLEQLNEKWTLFYAPVKVNNSSKTNRVLFLFFDTVRMLESVIRNRNVLLFPIDVLDKQFFSNKIDTLNLLDNELKFVETINKKAILHKVKKLLSVQSQIFLNTKNTKNREFYIWLYQSNVLKDHVYLSIDSETSITKSANQLLIYIVVALLLLLFYIIFIAYFFVYRVANPIQKLSESVNHYTENLGQTNKPPESDEQLLDYFEVEILKKRFENTVNRLNKQFHLMRRLFETSEFIASNPAKDSFFSYMKDLYKQEFNLNLSRFNAHNMIEFECSRVEQADNTISKNLLEKFRELGIHEELRAQIFHEQVFSYIRKLDLESELHKNLMQQKEFEIAEGISTSYNRIELSTDMDWSHYYLPARYLGGDFIDACKVEDNYDFLIGDVAGKGLGASMLSAQLRVGFQVLSSKQSSLESNIKRLNQNLCRRPIEGLFSTIFIARYHSFIKKLEYVSGGHNKMILIAPDGKLNWLSTQGMPLGILEDAEFQCQSTQVTAGSLLFLYTDGCTEAENLRQQLYGEARLIQLLKRHHLESAQKILNFLIEDIKSFTVGQEQSDDITFLVVRLT